MSSPMPLPGGSKKSVLIYGFEPFGKYRRNVTQAIIAGLPERPDWHRVVLPVRFEREIFLPLVEALQPDYILGMGQCPRGSLIRIERAGYNSMRECRSDAGEAISPGSPERLTPNWRIAPNSRRRDSYDAGRYVCNYSIYLLSQMAQAQNRRYAFLHVPKDYGLKQGIGQVVEILTRIES